MSTSTMPPPRYSIWQAVTVCLNLAMRALEEVRALARDGGKPGPAGLGFDDMKVLFDGRHTVTLRWERGDQVREETVVFRNMFYRDVYQEGRRYEPGDCVTWAGSLWHCNESTGDRPKGSDAWTLCVKCGRDGRDGKDGAKGDPGPQGKPGRDLTQMGPDGRKW